MAFTDQDREKMVETHTMVKAQDRSIQELKEEDKILHHRINVVRNMYGAIAAGISGTLAYMKIKLGG